MEAGENLLPEMMCPTSPLEANEQSDFFFFNHKMDDSKALLLHREN